MKFELRFGLCMVPISECDKSIVGSCNPFIVIPFTKLTAGMKKFKRHISFLVNWNLKYKKKNIQKPCSTIILSYILLQKFILYNKI